jgi:hypothetical protein
MDKSGWRQVRIMIVINGSSEALCLWRAKNFIISWTADRNWTIFRSLYVQGPSKFSVIFCRFVKAGNTYAQNFSCRVFQNYQSPLNGLKGVICTRTYIYCVFVSCVSWMQQIIFRRRSNLGISLYLYYLSLSLTILSVNSIQDSVLYHHC